MSYRQKVRSLGPPLPSFEKMAGICSAPDALITVMGGCSFFFNSLFQFVIKLNLFICH